MAGSGCGRVAHKEAQHLQLTECERGVLGRLNKFATELYGAESSVGLKIWVLQIGGGINAT